MINTDQTAGAHERIVADLQNLIRLQYVARSLPLDGNHVVKSLLVGQHRSRVRGRGMNFEELRHYRVGDDIRQMDWKVTNRTRKPHVRVYAEERERSVILIVDQSLSMFFGSKGSMKSVAAAEVAALLAWNVVHAGDRVGMLIYDDHKSTEIRPRRSQNQIMQILHALCEYSERLQHAKQYNSKQLNKMLRRVRNLVKHDALIYLISDLRDADEETGELLSALSNHNNIIINYLYDPLEHVLPNRGRLAVSDGKYQVEINAEDERLIDSYKQDNEERQLLIQHFLHARKVPILPISTIVPVDVQIIKMLGGSLNWLMTSANDFKDRSFGNTWLENIHEVVFPDPISWIPNTPFGWLLLLMVCAYVISKGWLLYCYWRKNAYRREALQNFYQAQSDYAKGNELAIKMLPELLRRVALMIGDRAYITSLTETQWQDFLLSGLGDKKLVTETFPDVLLHLVYLPDTAIRQLSKQQKKICFEWVELWLKSHQYNEEKEAPKS